MGSAYIVISRATSPLQGTITIVTLLITPLITTQWVGISGVVSPLVGVIIIVTLLITPPITTHEPPSTLMILDYGNYGIFLITHEPPRRAFAFVSFHNHAARSLELGNSRKIQSPKSLK